MENNIKIENLSIRFGEKNIFDNFSIEFECEKITGILAQSGRGKTTLLNWICENEIKNKKSVSYVFQEPRLIENLSAFENILIPLKNIFEKQIANEKAEFFLEKMKLANKKNDFPSKMSGGEKQRISLARALAFPSEILLLDEAFQSLDKETKMEIMTFVKDLLKKEKRTVIFVTHILEEAEFFCDKIVKI